MLRSVIALLLAGWMAWPAAAAAQPAPDLIVTLRDEQGQGVVANITVLAPAGTPVLARATTDAQGRAVIETLPISEVRVLVEGRLPNGVRLVQRGDDAKGIRLWLDAESTQLDLRVNPDGTIEPDPATMIEPEGSAIEPDPATMIEPEGSAIEPTSTPAAAPTVAAVPQPTRRPAPTPRPAMPTPAAAVQAGEPPAAALPLGGIALAVLLGGAIVAVLAARRRI
ncbi:MAG: hypothetical protein IPP13_16605 [Kouleothrix sp.]|jgi:hypothetical protein|nr:hypothetical protein [Kouleothrix sp.]